MDKWFFDLVGPEQDTWLWRRHAEDGKLLGMSAQGFKYYLDCVADAEQHGYTGPPSFRSVNSNASGAK
jgi:hypothetical protein